MNFIGRRVFSGAGVGLWLAAVAGAATFNVPPPASLSVTSAAGGTKVTYRGATNFQFLVQGSSNWLGWSLIGSNVATNQVLTFVDTQAQVMPFRFYTAVTLRTPFIYQGTFRIGEVGSFLLLARTNNQATFIGFNSTRHRGEFASPLAIGDDGKICGTFISGAPGCMTLTPFGTVTGNFTNGSSQVGTNYGVQKANVGIFNGAAGIYSGVVSGSVSGTARILLCPDGWMAFHFSVSPPAKTDGSLYQMAASGVVDFYLTGGDHILGTFNRQAKNFSLTIHDNSGAILIGTANLNLSELLF